MLGGLLIYVMTIYCSPALRYGALDGTFQGPDEILEVLALRLHQVGASQAEVVAFRADGAPWIWERIEWVSKRLGLKKSQVSSGLDWCHAVHHVSLAPTAWLAIAAWIGSGNRRTWQPN